MRVFIMGLFVVMIITGCKSKDEIDIVYKSNENLPQMRVDWEREYEAWKALKIQDYQFNYNLGDTGIVEKVTVNGKISSAIDVQTGEPGMAFIETIDALFDFIDRDFSNDENKNISTGQIGTYFSINYDPLYHYPVKYDRIDKYDKKYGNVRGNGVTIEIFEFKLFE